MLDCVFFKLVCHGKTLPFLKASCLSPPHFAVMMPRSLTHSVVVLTHFSSASLTSLMARLVSGHLKTLVSGSHIQSFTGSEIRCIVVILCISYHPIVAIALGSHRSFANNWTYSLTTCKTNASTWSHSQAPKTFDFFLNRKKF